MKVYNLTMHELTKEQIDELKRIYPRAEVLVEPAGKIFASIDDRLDYVLEIMNKLNNGDGVIVGGDTLFFMMLAEEIVKSDKCIIALHSNTERIRDENDRFVFVFKSWFSYIF